MYGTEVFLILCRIQNNVQTFKQGSVANDINPLKDAREFPQIPIAIVSKIACTDFEFYKKLSGGKCKKHKPGKPGRP